MKKLFGIGNKTKPRESDSAKGSSAKNSELDSELMKKKIEELNKKFKERSIKARISVYILHK